MRQIVFIILAFTFQAAASDRVTLSYDYTSTQIEPSGLSSTATTGSEQSQSLSVIKQHVLEGLDVNAGFSVKKPDYSQTALTNSQGQRYYLDKNGPQETSARLRLDYGKSETSGFVAISGNTSSSPYRKNLFNAGLKQSFYGQTTSVGIRASYLSQNQPENYFIDRDFRFKGRPKLIHGEEYTLSWDQALHPKLKSLVEISTAQKFETRPRNYGVHAALGAAPIKRWYAQLHAQYKFEDTHETLLDERGYFNQKSAQLVATWEPVYDLLVSAGYGINIEQENDPRVGSAQQIGSDQYSLGARYLATSQFEIEIQGQLAVTNTRQTDSQWSGNIAWLF